jgi:N-acyl-D-amino-acid deacylase
VVRSTGVEHVWVNGVATRVAGEDVPAAAPGRLLRG